MIITRAPFRISLMGGGSDIPAYYRKHSGKCLSFTINKFVYVATNPSFHHRYKFSYSKIEHTNALEEVEHPIIREVASDYAPPFIDFASFADVPAGTGLGSSSAFTAATALNFAAYNGTSFSNVALAEYCCAIEIDRLKEPIGKQDQYAVCCGGLNEFSFNRDDSVDVLPISGVRAGRFLENHLSLVFTGITRRAKTTLEEQSKNVASKAEVTEKQLEIMQMVDDMRETIEMRDAPECGRLLHHNWLLKQQLASKIGHDDISRMYDKLLSLGAYGGKVLGAGNGGFIAIFHPEGFQNMLYEHGFQTLEFRFWPDGAEIVEND